ncbi:protein Ras-2 [Microbotryum lychnidis-dioicae p1A1 Lamole]|uniref:Protein Ras-2 n=1 Tax=Microbotryum lychnidis-dioicae (strain p1A1 Lamole / MvSl-1064) TaxID=683840 RepID=U5H1E0_USTV1|nr:protein Ras-2 [Microbotryum lychnidis-dioicae p1A1 Lamole]|eukprot:KDE08743.1 protein Ras-2 [Microbotryum lychnidis-dioicae p1A1 Lamole]
MVMSCKIVVLGDGGVGKTALTIQLCLNHFIEVSMLTYDPTIEDSYRKHAIIDDQPYLLEILDTAGQEEYTALRDQWIREGEGFVLVYSITARATFERIERFRHQITRVKDSETIPVVLVGNKADRANEREVGRDEGQALAKKLGCEFVETSAKTRLNLELAYYTVVRMIRAQREGTTPGSKVAGGKKNRLPRGCSIL